MQVLPKKAWKETSKLANKDVMHDVMFDRSNVFGWDLGEKYSPEKEDFPLSFVLFARVEYNFP